MASNASAVQHSFAMKELRAKTVSPGKSTEGFVYFKLPDELNDSELWVVRVEAKKLGTKKTVDFAFNIKIEGDH